jgi:hypothetical protein
MSANRRVAARKEVEGITVNDLTSVTNYSVIARAGRIVNASNSGFLLEIDRKSLVPKDLRDNLSLESLIGQSMILYLPQMNLDLDGKVMRATHIGKGLFVIALDFAPDVPEYWRDCLVDLLPAPGEIEDKVANE